METRSGLALSAFWLLFLAIVTSIWSTPAAAEPRSGTKSAEELAGEAEEEAEEADEGALAGAEASNPTAAVNFQDIRYRYFDLRSGRQKHSFETEGAFVPHPRLKLTNELRGNYTDQGGSWEADVEELKLKAISLTDMMPFGVKAKFALGLEWLKDLGDFDEGTGTGSDQLAPLVGVGWLPTERDFVITLVQYFHSYDESSNAPTVRVTGPRLIYIRAIPQIQGWAKVDYKMAIDHKRSDDFTSTLELQVGTMFNRRIGMYAEFLVGNDILDTRAYDFGAGLAVRLMY